MDPRAEIDEIARDRTSGASEITARAADVLADLAREGDDPAAAVRDAVRTLVQGHPAMAPLIHLADRALTRLDDGDDLADLADGIAARRDRLGEQTADLVEDGSAVVTYSRSGTVLAALTRAAEAGRSFRVTVSEGRPGGEGVATARDLSRAGVDVTLTTDAALFSRLEDADLVLVGADALCLDGFVNKVGTGALCRAAREEDVGVIVAAGTDKLYPPQLGARPPVDAEGSWDVDVPEGVDVALPLFEVAPLDPVTAVVTEEGPWPPAVVADRLGEVVLDPGLASVLAS